LNLAVIDLGSNTFHLLIVNHNREGKRTEIFRKRVYVSLGEGGIEVLQASAIERGLKACIDFQSHLNIHQVEKLSIIGTAALRSASNSFEFVSKAESIFGKKITIIDGELEAKYIFRGVKLLSTMIDRSVIMDIGGGSTEFIIVENGINIWAQSYKLGVNVLHALFHHEEPISAINESLCRKHIQDTLHPFFSEARKNKIQALIGASGAFEVFETMSGKEIYTNKINTIPLSEANLIMAKIIKSNDTQRNQMEGLAHNRVKLIVVGMILVEEVIKAIYPSELVVTPFALKEGVLDELYNSINRAC
jgi:exopolyphosphatase / guanosine-5'-triphosphate,3'-diphosphate pyrophosphatase